LSGDAWREARHALRALRKRRGFTATVAVTLGLGIGACTAIFSLGYGILARPFPYREPERLVSVQSATTKGAANFAGASLLDLDDWSRHGRALESAALHISFPAILNPGSGPAQSVRLTFVTSQLFRTLGVAPALGRDFSPAEDQPGGDVFKAVLSHSLWQALFGADPNAIGRTIRLRGASYEVVA
jgi:hypothetical protein